MHAGSATAFFDHSKDTPFTSHLSSSRLGSGSDSYCCVFVFPRFAETDLSQISKPAYYTLFTSTRPPKPSPCLPPPANPPLKPQPSTKSYKLSTTCTAPLPVNPKRSAQITKLRDTANQAYRKSNYAEAVKLYTYAIDMALSRPGWEPVNLARDELSGLYANRSQAHMAQQAWPEGMIDAKASCDCKPIGNVKAWWRAGKCLAEMGRWEEAKTILERGLDIEGKTGEGGKELGALLEEVQQRLQKSA
ncbi:hypothetical protein KXV25_003566 [Aspergillus fumigatus]|nr:hypothetical protein KXV25_003566 [Aspergillus fumigatus]